MAGVEGIEALIEHIYAAAEHSAEWQQVAHRLAALFDADHGTILIDDDSAAGMHSSGATCPERITEYVSTYRAMDPLVEVGQIARMSQARRAFVSQELVDDRTLRESVFYNDYWRRWGNIFWACGGCYSVGDGVRVQFGVQRSKAHGQFDEHDRSLADRLLPHLLRAAMLATRLSALQTQATTRGHVQDQLQDATVVIESGERIVHMNARAKTLFDGASVNDALPLRALHLINTAELQRFIEAIVRARSAAPSAGPEVLRLRRTPPLPPLVALIVGSRRSPLPGTVQLFLRDPRWHALVPDHALATLFDLTPAQTRICSLLLQGETPDSIAERSDVSLATVRSQIKQAMEKVGVHRQVELVRVLGTALPALRQRPRHSA